MKGKETKENRSGKSKKGAVNILDILSYKEKTVFSKIYFTHGIVLIIQSFT